MASALIAAVSLSVACATLSVFVVSRRWAFIGEGISHSGFGGAGTAWVLSLIFPSLGMPWMPYLCAIIFCLLTALAIGFLSNHQHTNSDAAIGIFMVANLAWGFLARDIFRSLRHTEPGGFEDFLLGQMTRLSTGYALSVVMLSAAVVLAVAALGKEILYYCLDPVMARVSGIRAGMIHYLLLMLVTLTIVLGIPIAGSVLITALLVLPGATAFLLSQSLRSVFTIAITSSAIAAAAGICVHQHWRFVPAGPGIVLCLFAEFLFCYVGSQLGRFVHTDTSA